MFVHSYLITYSIHYHNTYFSNMLNLVLHFYEAFWIHRVGDNWLATTQFLNSSRGIEYLVFEHLPIKYILKILLRLV